MKRHLAGTLFAAMILAALLCSLAAASTRLKPSIVPETTDTTRIERTQSGTILYWAKDEAGVWYKAVELAVHDLIDVKVAVSVSFDEATEEYEYHYTVKSQGSSKQQIQDFGLCLESIPEAEGSFGYSFSDAFGSSNDEGWSFHNITDSDIWIWSCFPPSGIAAGSEESGFCFTTTSQPGIVTCFAIGANNAPPDRAWDVDFPAPAMEDRGVKGLTIGPVPELYDPEKLAGRLLSYMPICLEQGWLTEPVQSLLKTQIEKIHSDFATQRKEDASARLEQCIQFIAGMGEGEVSDEARTLFDLNLRYLQSYVP